MNRPCPSDCPHYSALAEDRRDDWRQRSQRDLDHEADKAADQAERAFERMGEL